VSEDGSVPGASGPAVDAAAAKVVARSLGLPRSLGLRDLVLSQVLLVVGTNWIAVAAQLGSTGILVWVLGFALFHLPLVAAVMHLSRRYPLEGGLYQWTKLELGELPGFLVAWNGWLFVVVFMSSLGIAAATAIAYATGGEVAGIERPGVIAGASVVVLAVLVAVTLAGLQVGRWLHDAGAVLLLTAFVALVALLARQLATVGWSPPVGTAALDLAALNVFVKVSVYGLAGLEAMAILAGETRAPHRAIGRSVVAAAPLILLFYVVGTALMVVTVPRDEIDLVNPVAQMLVRSAAGDSGGASTAPSTLAAGFAILVLLLFLRDFAQASQAFAVNSRLPMVVGWDRLLPTWLGRLDARGVPRNSILAVGALTLASALGAGVGASRQEAYQLILAAAGVFFALTYLALFALPLLGRRTRESGAASPGLRVACISGGLMTLAFLALSLFPFTEVAHPARYGFQVLAVAAAGEGVGLALYWRGRRRAAAPVIPSAPRRSS
jgi:amino acid transporter